MPADSGSPDAPPTGRDRALVVVARDRPEVWQSLTRQFAGSADVQVLLDRRQCDRRQGDRRQQSRTHALDRRCRDRRRPPRIETDVRARHYVIVRPQQRTVQA